MPIRFLAACALAFAVTIGPAEAKMILLGPLWAGPGVM
jgi:hypothetical protein